MLEGGGGGGSRGGGGGSTGSGGPGLGRNPSKGENVRGLRGKPRQSQLTSPATWGHRLRGRGGPEVDGNCSWCCLSASAGQPRPLPGPLCAEYLRGVRGLLWRRRGERSLGWKEKPSLMLSRTEGATYVKPWAEAEGSSAAAAAAGPAQAREPGARSARPTRKAWLALSLRAVSSGLSTGVCRVKWVSNWLTSSSDCCGRTGVGRGQGVSKKGSSPAPGPRAPTHQTGPERGVHTAGQEVVPVDVPEKGVPLWAERPNMPMVRPLGSGTLPSSTP